MTNSHIKDFTKGNITKDLIIFAWPLLLSNILQVVYSMVDMIVVGKVMGKVGTSAVTVGGDVTNLLTFIGMGFASAGQVLIARYVGAKQRDKIGKFVGTMTSFLFIMAIVVSIFGLVSQDLILRLMNTPAEAYDGAAAYSSICISGLVFIYGYNVTSAILRGMGDSKHPLLFIAIAALINIVLDLIFVAGFNMGAGGAALATVVSQAISFILCLIFLIRKKEMFSLNIAKNDFIHWNRDMLSAFVKLGVPMAIKFAAISVSRMFVNSWINGYGVAVSGFAGIANKLASVVNLFSNAMNTAGSTMVGQNIVAGQFDRVNKILKNLLIITLSIAIAFSIAMVLFPQEIFALFTDSSETEVLELADVYVPIALMMFLSSSLRATMNALINGSGNVKTNFLTAILDGIVLRIGLSLLFGVALKMEYFGFWLGDAIAGYTPFFIGLVFYLTGSWKKGVKPREQTE
ncbi:MAG: MATE family efflux transporter [Oscillospiraceae bacterium]|nr:MATE family efflux transporter [Oscillospiraceae bacterium]